MMKFGRELPVGTRVYHWRRTRKSSYFSTMGSEISPENLYLYSYSFVYCGDGMWATPYIVENWKDRPCANPHTTLFHILYHKLNS
jgi:hypothetical protein